MFGVSEEVGEDLSKFGVHYCTFDQDVLRMQLTQTSLIDCLRHMRDGKVKRLRTVALKSIQIRFF